MVAAMAAAPAHDKAASSPRTVWPWSGHSHGAAARQGWQGALRSKRNETALSAAKIQQARPSRRGAASDAKKQEERRAVYHHPHSALSSRNPGDLALRAA